MTWLIIGIILLLGGVYGWATHNGTTRGMTGIRIYLILSFAGVILTMVGLYAMKILPLD